MKTTTGFRGAVANHAARMMVSMAVGACAAACGSTSADSGASTRDAASDGDAGSALPFDDAATSSDAGWTEIDGGFVVGDGGVVRADRFVTKVVSFTPGECAGFGIPSMPGVVMGPPFGAGDTGGSLDVVSLGNGGEIVVSFEPNAVVDGPGADFLVFENAFYAGGDARKPFAELGEVSVSDDGASWTTFACTATAYPYGACAGWRAVYSNPTNGISPIDPAVAGGDPFDLADVGVTRARFVRVRDKSHETCGAPPNRSTSNGFDLDAMSIVNAEQK